MQKLLMESNIALNSFQHFAYCKRQWGLLIIENQWAENTKTIEGDIVHTLVDDPFFDEQRKNLRVVRSLPVYFDKHNIYGVCDCVTFLTNDSTVEINVVEYKNGKPQQTGVINYPDSLQLAAQMMCINNMFETRSKGCIYYHSIRRRVELKNFESLQKDVIDVINQMNYYISNGIIPSKEVCHNCNNCSLETICMPSVAIKSTTRDRLSKLWVNK